MNRPEKNQSDGPEWLDRPEELRTPEGRARLRAKWGGEPERLARLEADIALEILLENRPQPSISSNFTARVLDSIAEHAPSQTAAWSLQDLLRPIRSRWLPWFAGAAVVLAASGIAWSQLGRRHRSDMARGMIEVSTVTRNASEVNLEDFDAIRRLGSLPAAAGSARTQRGAPAPPAIPPDMPPPTRPVVDELRMLISASLDEREARLDAFGENFRQHLRARLRELEAMPPDDRELALRLEELQVHFARLLQAAGPERATALRRSPAHIRSLLEERLVAWEALDPAIRQVLLENEANLGLFAQIERARPGEAPELLAQIPAERRTDIETQLARWQHLPAGDRTRALAHFNRFFQLRPDERQRILATLSEPERRQMEESLRRFAQMSEKERQIRLRSFARFADMSESQRSGFLASAARWQSLSAAEREAWRRLVAQLPPTPPMPPEGTVALSRTNGPAR